MPPSETQPIKNGIQKGGFTVMNKLALDRFSGGVLGSLGWSLSALAQLRAARIGKDLLASPWDTCVGPWLGSCSVSSGSAGVPILQSVRHPTRSTQNMSKWLLPAKCTICRYVCSRIVLFRQTYGGDKMWFRLFSKALLARMCFILGFCVSSCDNTHEHISELCRQPLLKRNLASRALHTTYVHEITKALARSSHFVLRIFPYVTVGPTICFGR